jgi:hypothetical protein
MILITLPDLSFALTTEPNIEIPKVTYESFEEDCGDRMNINFY